jgi:hypothetical protein
VIVAAYAKKKACVPLRICLKEVFKLVNAGKAGGVELSFS